MDLMDLLKASGGGDSVGQLASDDGLAGFRRALETGGHDRNIDDPSLMGAAETRADGNDILGMARKFF